LKKFAKIALNYKIEEVVEIEEVDENCSKLQNCGGGFLENFWGIFR
jgi:hypothetical protein